MAASLHNTKRHRFHLDDESKIWYIAMQDRRNINRDEDKKKEVSVKYRKKYEFADRVEMYNSRNVIIKKKWIIRKLMQSISEKEERNKSAKTRDMERKRARKNKRESVKLCTYIDILYIYI